MVVECAWCSAQWEATAQQATYARNGKNVFCPGGICHNEFKKNNRASSKTNAPWGWLGCKHTLNELPTQESPEVYVGY